MGSKKKKTKATTSSDATTSTDATASDCATGTDVRTSEPVSNDAGAVAVAEPVTTLPPKTKEKKKRPGATNTSASGPNSLADVFAGYLAGLEGQGKSTGTIASYGMELKSAMAALGAETKVADLTVEVVQAYFISKPVTKLKSGKPKSPLSIDKTRRVLRQALVWAAAAGLIEKAPLPETVKAK